MKNIFLQILAIVAISAVLGWIYRNSLPDDCKGSKKLAWIREEKPLVFASDSAVFGDLMNPASDTAKKNFSPVKIDTLAAKKTDSIPQKKISSDTAKTKISTAAESKPEVKNITYEQTAKLKANPNVLFIDARNAEDFAAGHIEGAKNIFTHEFEQHMPEIMPIPRDKPIVVYCGGGTCELSHELAEQLIALGFQRVYVYVGGWTEWSKKVAEQK